MVPAKHEYFYQYNDFPAIGLNLQDSEVGSVKNVVIDGDYDIGVNIHRTKVTEINGMTVIGRGRGTGVYFGSSKMMPKDFLQLLEMIGNHRTDSFSDDQVNHILESLKTIEAELSKREPDKTLLHQSLNFISSLFQNSANVITVVSGLAALLN